MCGLCFAAVLIAIGIALKIYIKLNTRWNNSYKCLIGKTAIVTGANTGIGYPTALDFAMRGARVILACRNAEKANEARTKITAATGNQNVIVKLIDMASFESVRAFAKDINETETRIDILVNNAGVIHLNDKRTNDGLLEVMQVNHLSPFLLTHLLINKIKSTPASRVVNVSSYMAKMANLTKADQIDEYPSGGNLKANTDLYSNTKLCNVLFTIELAKKLEDFGVGVYSCHPGATKTEIARNITGWMSIVMRLQSIFFWTPEEGAQATIYTALSNGVQGLEGEMFGNCKKVGPYETAKDVVLAKAVWRKSEELTKLTEAEIL